MTELAITRGYPASGKTTWSKAQAAESGWARVCRDDLRRMLFGLDGRLPHELEHRVSLAEQAQVEALLKAGVSVVVDATHLRLRTARTWADMALRLGATFTVHDFPAPVGECVRRDAQRGAAGGRAVGETRIREMADKFPQSRWEPVLPRVREGHSLPDPYVVDPTLPPAYIVDVDGTLAEMVDRGPFDWHLVGTDKPSTGTVEMVRRLSMDARIVVMSGRDESCRGTTEKWLTDHSVPFDELHMRPARDIRKDSAVKLELFDKQVRHRFNVLGAIDDRLSVCRLWHQLGIPLFRVGDPDAAEF